MNGDNSSLLFTRTGGTLVVTLTRPKLSAEALRLLSRGMREAESAPDLRSVILTGQGDVFCLGGDLGNAVGGSSLDVLEFGEAFIELHREVTGLKLPVIAAVNGLAHGGGFSLVEACDVAVAAESARFAIPEIRTGAAPMMALAGAHRTLTRKQAMWLALLGEELDANQALQLGIVNLVVSDDQVMPTALSVAGRLAGYKATSLQIVKAAYRSMDEGRFERQLRHGLSHLVVLLGV
ncbi:enoyl-CoA hydratase/isomerase family protein [Carboxydochorda subterranea]|uniref:Enoyl-CoA hydratase/isomerase family protein n=1 Tax=Carboxydichorda subterranea TaxID=3109565 RepID=A0ABZ1C3Y3_9FIRM|nr:enoyl-CoA hydratase/isomerase family protein [Limnochorda sp. L945t]WRP18733.1 enoyl-CoA hydratase/isomerase family protein [Limnochorda sp. L945t]